MTGPRLVEQRIYLEPIDSDIIFGLPKICTVRVEGFSLRSDAGKGMYMRGKSSRRVKYSVYSSVGEGYAGQRDERYLQLPEGIEQISALAVRVTAGTTSDKQKAVVTESYLRNNFTYSLTTSGPPAGVGPIEDFLFNTRRGYCEHYSTAMVLMLRSLDVPARVVTGYYGGEKNEYGGYIIVRQSSAHSWVEVLIGNQWKRYDPTPAVSVGRQSGLALFMDSIQLNWSRYVIGFSSYDQRNIVRSLTIPFRLKQFPGVRQLDTIMLLYGAGAVALVFLLIFLFPLVARKRKYGFITERYLSLRRLLSRRGLRIKPSMTAGEIQRTALPSGISADLDEFLRLYEEHRFGRRELSPEDRERYERLLKEMKRKMS